MSTCEVDDEVVVISESLRGILWGVFLAGAEPGDCKSWRGRLQVGGEEWEPIVIVVVCLVALLVGGVKNLKRKGVLAVEEERKDGGGLKMEGWWLGREILRLKMPPLSLQRPPWWLSSSVRDNRGGAKFNE